MEMSDAQFLRWLHDLLRFKYHEHPQEEWMQRLERLADYVEVTSRERRLEIRKAGWWDDLVRHRRQQRTNVSGSRQVREEER